MTPKPKPRKDTRLAGLKAALRTAAIWSGDGPSAMIFRIDQLIRAERRRKPKKK